jgi:hypothetical protein
VKERKHRLPVTEESVFPGRGPGHFGDDVRPAINFRRAIDDVRARSLVMLVAKPGAGSRPLFYVDFMTCLHQGQHPGWRQADAHFQITGLLWHTEVHLSVSLP